MHGSFDDGGLDEVVVEQRRQVGLQAAMVMDSLDADVLEALLHIKEAMQEAVKTMTGRGFTWRAMSALMISQALNLVVSDEEPVG